MDRLPSNIMFDILSRLSVKSLARLQCVSKLWHKYIGDPYLGVIHGGRNLQEPTPIMFHQNPHAELPRTLCFHTMESSKHERNSADHLLKDLDLEYVCKKPLDESSVIRVQVLGSCNGLFFIAEDDAEAVTTMAVIHPLRRECYELPLFPLPLSYYMCRESCGLGFDASTNTLKMVCVLLRKTISPRNLDLVRKNLCTMVHVFGTNSWCEIPQVPSYPVKGEAVFAHGCLHWLVSYLDRRTDDDVIWFDVRNEEFGLINPPKAGVRTTDDRLVDINGEVGLVYNNSVTMEVWVLKRKEWVLHCQFDQKPPLPRNCKKVLGSWNKDGDILIKGITDARDRFFVYSLKSGGVHEVDIVGQEILQFDPWHICETGIIMYPNSLLSIHGINTNSPIRSKAVSDKSCYF